MNEYAPLTWVGAAKKHIDLLDRVQSRPINIINGEDSTTTKSLQRRWDLAGLAVMFKYKRSKCHICGSQFVGRHVPSGPQRECRIHWSSHVARHDDTRDYLLQNIQGCGNTVILSCAPRHAVHSIQRIKIVINGFLQIIF